MLAAFNRERKQRAAREAAKAATLRATPAFVEPHAASALAETAAPATSTETKGPPDGPPSFSGGSRRR